MAQMFCFGPSVEPKWPHIQEAKAALWGQNGPIKITVYIFRKTVRLLKKIIVENYSFFENYSRSWKTKKL